MRHVRKEIEEEEKRVWHSDSPGYWERWRNTEIEREKKEANAEAPLTYVFINNAFPPKAYRKEGDVYFFENEFKRFNGKAVYNLCCACLPEKAKYSTGNRVYTEEFGCRLSLCGTHSFI